MAEMLKQGGYDTCACVHVGPKAGQTEKGWGKLTFFTGGKKKSEKLETVCHRDTKMLLINNCSQMKRQIANGVKTKKNGWTHERKACFVSTEALAVPSVLRATTTEASRSSRRPRGFYHVSGKHSYLSHPRLLWWCWHSPRTPGKR